MASCSVDSNGRTIQTDILVYGYIRNVMEEHQLEIPDEIIGVCFVFWFIQTCDAWDESLCTDFAAINGQYAKLNAGKISTLFGSKSVDSGSYEWRIKFVTKIPWCCLGIIKDELDILKMKKTSNCFFRNGDGIGLVPGTGNLYLYDFFEIEKGYCQQEKDKDTIISMTLDMDNKTINYKINDKQYESKRITLDINKYRFAVSIKKVGAEIAFL